MGVILARRWVRQPWSLSAIDRGNRVTAKLVTAYNVATGQDHVATWPVEGQEGAFARRAPSRRGLGLFSASGEDGIRILQTTLGDTYSLMVVLDPVGAPASVNAVASTENGSYSNLQVDSDGSVSSNAYDDTFTLRTVTSGAGALVAGSLNVFIATKSAAGPLDFYVNGALIGSTASYTGYNLEGSYVTCTGSDSLRPMMLCNWARKINAAEVLSLSRNPWQVFAPERIFVKSSAVAPTYSYARPSLDGVGNSGWTVF